MFNVKRLHFVGSAESECAASREVLLNLGVTTLSARSEEGASVARLRSLGANGLDRARRPSRRRRERGHLCRRRSPRYNPESWQPAEPEFPVIPRAEMLAS
jgi:hypothetical protein